MTANHFAALLDGVKRRVIEDGGNALYHGKRTTYLPETEVLAALAAAVPADLAEAVWKPIETAPRGGEWFMARSEHGQTRAVHYADEYDRFPISHDGVVWSTAPVEWMPLSVFPALLARIAAQEARIEGLQRTYDDLYSDALADAKSDAQDFDSDLWIEVRKYLTELELDWRDYQDDGILAEQAIEYIRECMNEETHRAEAAETALAASEDKVAKLQAAVEAAAKIGRIIGFLGEDEGRIEAFREACGPELLAKARAAITEVGK